MLGTFNANTTPTDAQAQQVIDDTVAALLADVGEPPAPGVFEAPEITIAMRSAVEWQAAADIELAYPNRDADIRVADQLTIRAALALATLKRALQQAGAGVVDVVPTWVMNAPPGWGDLSPGSGIEAISGNNPYGQIGGGPFG
jgi:enamine deaminase RidA (YjgF/YER057c/UK114 family)